METSAQFSFRAPTPFIAETEAAARLASLSRSEYARVQQTGALKHDTDLLIDQVRAISNRRLMYRYAEVTLNHLKKVEEALRLLTGR